MRPATGDTANPSISATAWPIRLANSIPASYTIWYNSSDSKYYGECNIPGDSDVAGSTTFATTMQTVLDTSPALVFLREMDVTTTASLQYPTNCQIVGSGVGKTIIRSAVDDFIFKPAAATPKRYVQIKDMSIFPTADTANIGGVLLDGCCFSNLQNLHIESQAGTKANSIGVKIVDTGHVGAYFNQIQNCDIRSFKIGLWFANEPLWTPNNNTVIAGRIQLNTTGVWFEQGACNWLFNTDLETNGIGVDVDAEMNGIIGGFTEGNTTADIDVADNEQFMALGARRDINFWGGGGTGIFQFLGGDYGNGESMLKAMPTGATVQLLRDDDTKMWGAPGTTYIDWGAGTWTKLNFGFWQPRRMRIVITGSGNEAGNSKGLAIYKGETKMCEVLWDGNALQYALAGAWTSINETGDTALNMRVKGSSGTENITLYSAEMQFA